jgi:hypothetical protein
MKALTSFGTSFGTPGVERNSPSGRPVHSCSEVFRRILAETLADFERRELECFGMLPAVAMPSDYPSVGSTAA